MIRFHAYQMKQLPAPDGPCSRLEDSFGIYVHLPSGEVGPTGCIANYPSPYIGEDFHDQNDYSARWGMKLVLSRLLW